MGLCHTARTAAVGVPANLEALEIENSADRDPRAAHNDPEVDMHGIVRTTASARDPDGALRIPRAEGPGVLRLKESPPPKPLSQSKQAPATFSARPIPRANDDIFAR